MEILFDKKFTEKDLDRYIKEIYSNTINNLYSPVIFNLELVEWISSEEITFLYAWITQLIIHGKKVEVQLPVRSELEGDEIEFKWIASEELNELTKKKVTFKIIEKYGPDKIKVRLNKCLDRRRTLNVHLYYDWQLFNTSIPDTAIKNLPDGLNQIIDAKVENRNKYAQIKKVLPFHVIPTERYSKESVDRKFYKNTSGQFTLDDEITALLNANNCYSPFENKVISDIITKELFMNSSEHAQTDECYFTSALLNKWEKTNNQYFTDHFLLEKDESTLDFFKDKVKLESTVRREVIDSSIKNPQKIREKIEKDAEDGRIIANLTKLSEYSVFKNQSFLEFTFIDFGIGIFETLKEAYFEKKDFLKRKLSKNIEEKHIHTQIIEYAFLLDSSKDPFDNRIERAELIPRGLYFLIDMVRRYKALMIVRSGYGKVIYDFSDRIIIVRADNDEILVKRERVYIAKDAVIQTGNKESFFQGTMITIILPEREKGKFRKAGVRIDDLELNKNIYNRDNNDTYPKELFAPQYYEYLPLAFLYQVAKSREFFGNNLQSIYNDKNTIINTVFISINNKLKELNENPESGVLFIDFENLPKRNYIYKILLYLSNSPFVNEKVKVVAVNLDNDELNTLKELTSNDAEDDAKQNKVLSKETSFLFKAVPCLKLNKLPNQKTDSTNIQWIGVHDVENDLFLTNLLLGGKDIHISNIDDKYQYLYEGNVISLSSDGWATSIFSDISEISIKPKEKAIEVISNWILKEIIKDGELITEKHPKKRLFLTSQGAYQKKYLSFFDTLSFDYSAEYFSRYLLDKYIDTLIVEFESKTNLVFEDLSLSQKYIIKRTFKFDKILAVTVSSQFLAIQLRNLIWQNGIYSFFVKDKNESEGKELFKRFNGILNANIISKDSLVEFFSLNKNQIDSYFEMSGTREINLEDCPDLIKLSSYHSFDKEKPFEKIKTGQHIIVINDVISTGSLVGKIIEGIEKKKSTIQAILSIADTRNKGTNPINEHGSYFFNKYENRIISIVSSEVHNDLKIERPKYKPEGDYSIKRINPILNTIVTLNSKHSEKNRELLENQTLRKLKIKEDIFQIGHFKQSSISCSSYFTDMNMLLRGKRGEDLLKILKKRMDKRLSEISHSVCEPFFVFHPVYSGIEEISKESYFKVFNPNREEGKLDLSNVVSLQRFETPYGWRFVFPSKRFNNILKGQKVLIVDSGTLSGQSLVQLIDAVSIYEVERIDVLMIIGRLDDFQREFYSRLQKLKVKTLGDGYKQASSELNIFFGANLHIPPFHTEDKCPFCKEIKILNAYLIDYSDTNNLPSEAKSYISCRLEEIKKQENGEDKITPYYIPKDKTTDEHDFKSIFLMRDLLGKIDGYRFYEDYFDEIDALCGRYPTINQEQFQNDDIFRNENDLRQFEQILICVLHEPILVSSIKNLLKNLYDLLEYIVNSVIVGNITICSLNYNWSKYSMLRVYYSLFFNDTKFFQFSNIQKIFNFCYDEKHSLNYMSFLLWEPSEYVKQKRLILDEFSKELYKTDFNQSESRTSKQTLIRNLLKQYHSVDPCLTVKDALHNLKTFYDRVYTTDHDSLFRSNIRQINTRIKNKKIEEVGSIFIENIMEVQQIFDKKLLAHLSILKEDPFCGNIFNSKLFGDESIYFQLRELSELYKDIKEMLPQTNLKYKGEKSDIFQKMQLYFERIRHIERNHISSVFLETFVTSYTFKPYDLVNDLFDSEDITKLQSERKNFNFSNKISQDIILEGRQCLQFVFREVIENSVKRERHDNTTLSFQSETSDDETKVIIKQNKPFIPPEDPEDKEQNGGFVRNIKNVLELGFGRVEDNRNDTESKEYIIELIFKT